MGVTTVDQMRTVTDYRIEKLDRNGTHWRPYASNATRMWAERDATKYQRALPHDTFRAEPIATRMTRVRLIRQYIARDMARLGPGE